MHSKDHLSPSPTVDKNGKATTVYRRNVSAPSGNLAMPAPSLPPTTSMRNPRHAIIDDAWETLFEGILKHRLPTYKDRMTNFYRNLSAAESDEYPYQVLETVTAIAPKSFGQSGIRCLLVAISDNDQSGVKALHAHRDYLASHPADIPHFLPMKNLLAEQLGTEQGQDGTIANIAEHLYAKACYEKLALDSDLYSTSPRYKDATAVIQKVQQHPKHVDALMEYIARGHNDPEFDGFEEYIAGGALREGTL